MAVTAAKRGGRVGRAAPRKPGLKHSDDGGRTVIVAVTASKAREEFSSWISIVSFGHKWLVLKRHGKPVAAMIPLADLKVLRDLEDKIDLEAARAALAEPGETPWEVVKEKLGI